MRKTAEQIEALRQEAVCLWQQGTLTITEIAARLGVTRKFVYTTLQRFHEDKENPFHDKRRGNGRPPLYENLNQVVWAIRSEHPDWGPIMICHHLEKHLADYGLTQVPTPGTVAIAIRELGLARKQVGPKDKRLYPDPDARPDQPGTITVDLWGPWRCRAAKLYLVTAMDRYSRMAVCAPASSLQFGQEIAPGVSVNSWINAIALAIKYLLPPGVTPKTLYVDNGVGLVPVLGVMTKALKYALSIFPRVVFIPPAQPWRNGRLERFHWTMEREYFARERPSLMSEALNGLVDYLNWYNRERPHTSLGFVPPVAKLGCDPSLIPLIGLQALTTPVQVGDDLNPIGVVEAIRMVEDKGRLCLFQEADTIYLPDVLAGQYVRVQLFMNGTGRVLWQRKKADEPIVVADLVHHLGKKGHGFVTQLIPREFGYDVPGNARLDSYAYEQAKLRRYKKAPASDGDSG
jgi:transposase InsO family protein